MGIAYFAKLYAQLQTGVPNMDRFAIRGRVLFSATRAGVDPRVIMGIVHNESGGNPAHYLGDINAAGGPSIGPMQVYRRTALDLGLWTPIDSADRGAYAALAPNEALGIRWGVSVFVEKLRLARGDVLDAVRRYNGAGDAAVAYRDRVTQFLADTYGSLA